MSPRRSGRRRRERASCSPTPAPTARSEGAASALAGRDFQRDLSAAIEERRFEVGAPDHGRRLDAFLAERMSWRSRTRIQAMVAAGRVLVERGKDQKPPIAARLRAGTPLRRGNLVIVRLDSAFVDAGNDYEHDSPHLAIVYQDDHLLAVDKPAPMNVYPTRRHLGGSLAELVHRRHRALGLAGSPPSPCHRLDRETSGLVVFARDRATRADLGRQFEERSVEKTYLALVAGLPPDDEGVVDLALGRDLASRVEIKQAARLDGGGLAARTRWRVRARIPPAERALVVEAGGAARESAVPRHPAGCTLVELSPETGRQHQLRAHCAAIGHPILGDKLYLGGDDLFLASLERPLTPGELAALGGLDRLALHAWRLALRHPARGERLAIEAPAPRHLGI